MVKSRFPGSRYVVVALAFALSASSAFSQPISIPPGEVFPQSRPRAKIYSSPSFSGPAQDLTVGEHRVSGASSIHVAHGFVALLYQFADDVGGYGISVDLLEDHPDLAAIGLSHVSFITVFPATRDNYFWARGAIRNGQYVAGHWERSHAGGNPVNTVAVVSPPLPGRSATVGTIVQRQGSVWTVTHLGTQSSADADVWALADRQMGVIGSDYGGPQRIGDAAFQRSSSVFPDSINFWYPNPPSMPAYDHRGRSKKTLVGTILGKVTKTWTADVPQISGGVITRQPVTVEYEVSSPPHLTDLGAPYEDYDLNVDVAPFPEYQYLINDSHKPERSTIKLVKDLTPFGDGDPCIAPFIGIEAEIDLPDDAKRKLLATLTPRVGKAIALYGPWIYDVGHCDHPEIHPAEQIWWTDIDPGSAMRRYNLNVIADSSGRYLWHMQMDGSNKMRPWASPPITGVFAIAFEVPLSPDSAIQSGKQFKVEDVEFSNVRVLPDNSPQFDLKYHGSTLVSFVPGHPVFKVSYERVGLKPGSSNVVRGFLVIETTVGSVKQKSTNAEVGQYHFYAPQGTDPDNNNIPELLEPQIFKKTPGQYLFRIVEKSLSNQPQMNSQ